VKLATIVALAALALPTVALAETGNRPSNNGAASHSNGLAPSPGVTQNAPGQQRPRNGSPGDPGNTGSDSGMEASDMGGSGAANTGQKTTTDPATAGQSGARTGSPPSSR
jgi:hypothetical protein